MLDNNNLLYKKGNITTIPEWSNVTKLSIIDNTSKFVIVKTTKN